MARWKRAPSALFMFSLGAFAHPAAAVEPPTVTLIVQAPARTSRLALAAFRSELERIPDLQATLVWTTADGLALGDEFAAPIQIRLRGRCHMVGVAPTTERAPGAYAWAHVVDGRVLPFIEIDCDRLRGALFSVMWGEDFQHRDLLLGRALARVAAHELHHVLGGDHDHATAGLAAARLSAANLIRGEARLYSDFRAE